MSERKTGRSRLWMVLQIVVLLILVASLWHRGHERRAELRVRTLVEEHLGPIRPGGYVTAGVPGSRNGFTWLTAGAAIVSTGNFFGEVRAVADQPPESWPPEETIERMMADRAAGLELLHTAAAHPELSLGLEYGSGHGVELPNLVAFNNAARTLQAHARWSLHRGDPEAALTSLRSLVLLARGLEQESLLILQSFGGSVERRAHRVIGEWLEMGGVTPELASELSAMLSKLPRADWPRALGFEAASTLRNYDAEAFGVPRWRVRLLGRSCMRELAIRYAEIGRRSSEPFVDLETELWSAEGLVGSAERRQSWTGRLCEADIDRVAPPAGLVSQVLLYSTGRNLTRLALDLAAAGAREDRFPVALTAFDPVADPVTGELPRYELRDDGSAVLSYPAAEQRVAAQQEGESPRRRRVHSLRVWLPAPAPAGAE